MYYFDVCSITAMKCVNLAQVPNVLFDWVRCAQCWLWLLAHLLVHRYEIWYVNNNNNNNWSLSGGEHRWFKRSTRKKMSVMSDIHIIIIIIIIIEAWGVWITAGSRVVPGRKGLWQETSIIIIIIIIIMRRHSLDIDIGIGIFVSCNWVDTRWQYYSTYTSTIKNFGWKAFWDLNPDGRTKINDELTA